MLELVEITPVPNKRERNNCQLTHNGHNDLHRLFTALRHIMHQTRKGIVVIGDYGGHIQGGSQFAVPYLGYPCLTPNARTALMLFRI